MISANRQMEVIRRTEAAGATFLPKPVTESALADFLTSALSGKRQTPMNDDTHTDRAAARCPDRAGESRRQQCRDESERAGSRGSRSSPCRRPVS